MTAAQALATAAAQGLSRLDTQWLLLFALGRPMSERAWLLAHDDEALAGLMPDAWLSLCRRRAAGLSLAYLSGEKEFFGLMLQVDARVLVPRAETETLVEWALELAALTPHARVLDLGTGSGAIALALKHARAHWRLSATDASADALQVAHENAARLGLEIEFLHGDWLAPVQGRRFELIVANPPYVAQDDPHLAALWAEPLSALGSGDYGLDALREIVRSAPGCLAPGGWLLLEHGYDQEDAVAALLRERGFEAPLCRKDLAGIPRCSGAQWRTVK